MLSQLDYPLSLNLRYYRRTLLTVKKENCIKQSLKPTGKDPAAQELQNTNGRNQRGPNSTKWRGRCAHGLENSTWLRHQLSSNWSTGLAQRPQYQARLRRHRPIHSKIYMERHRPYNTQTILKNKMWELHRTFKAYYIIISYRQCGVGRATENQDPPPQVMSQSANAQLAFYKDTTIQWFGDDFMNVALKSQAARGEPKEKKQPRRKTELYQNRRTFAHQMAQSIEWKDNQGNGRKCLQITWSHKELICKNT